jgi:hypothetical protein
MVRFANPTGGLLSSAPRMRLYDGPVEVGSLPADPFDIFVGFENRTAAVEMTQYLVDGNSQRTVAAHDAIENDDKPANGLRVSVPGYFPIDRQLSIDDAFASCRSRRRRSGP